MKKCVQCLVCFLLCVFPTLSLATEFYLTFIQSILKIFFMHISMLRAVVDCSHFTMIKRYNNCGKKPTESGMHVTVLIFLQYFTFYKIAQEFDSHPYFSLDTKKTVDKWSS